MKKGTLNSQVCDGNASLFASSAPLAKALSKDKRQKGHKLGDMFARNRLALSSFFSHVRRPMHALETTPMMHHHAFAGGVMGRHPMHAYPAGKALRFRGARISGTRAHRKRGKGDVFAGMDEWNGQDWNSPAWNSNWLFPPSSGEGAGGGFKSCSEAGWNCNVWLRRDYDLQAWMVTGLDLLLD